MNFTIYDENLIPTALIDGYKSYIWARRYNAEGDCELYLPATKETIDLLKIGRFIGKDGSFMLCEIKRVTLTTDAEDGNYLAVEGHDISSWLNQRIIWGTETCAGRVEEFLRFLVASTIGSLASSERQITVGGYGVTMGTDSGLTEVANQQVSYRNIAEFMKETCETYGWGYRLKFDEGLKFEVYAGADRSDSVVFSDYFENIASSEYEENATHLGNVTLIGGSGEGPSRRRAVAGDYTGINRFELFSDAKDQSDQVRFEELREQYPSGTISGTDYIVPVLNISVMNDDHLRILRERYPSGTEVLIDGSTFYQLTNQKIATLPSSSPADGDECTMDDVLYETWLLADGYEKMAEYGETVSFSGTIEPHTTFELGVDYDLGDIVTVENSFGISAEARITEVIEAEDDNGYTCLPTYEFITRR